METCTTNGIKISVETFFHSEHSNPVRRKFLHVYQITISNTNPFAVQLLSRHWKIMEGTGLTKEVRGEGVIGKQPVIEPGDAHTYDSFCVLVSEIGWMRGTYQMIKTETAESFEVEIPRFVLEAPSLLN